jgi:hypothetical protein
LGLRKKLTLGLLGSLVLAAIPSAAMLWIGIRENSQYEFISDLGKLDLVYSATIFLSWLIPITLTLMALYGVVLFTNHGATSRQLRN